MLNNQSITVLASAVYNCRNFVSKTIVSTYKISKVMSVFSKAYINFGFTNNVANNVTVSFFIIGKSGNQIIVETNS